MRSRTVIVVAHRLSTVRDADLIAVCSGGKVAALGTHEDLIATCGLYRGLVKRQLQWGAGGLLNTTAESNYSLSETFAPSQSADVLREDYSNRGGNVEDDAEDFVKSEEEQIVDLPTF